MCPAGRDRRCCLVPAVFFWFNVYIYEIFIDVKSVYVYIVFTTRGEGEHARHTSRKVAETPGGGSQPLSMEQPNDADPQC